VVALADAFVDRLEAGRAKFKVTSRASTGARVVPRPDRLETGRGGDRDPALLHPEQVAAAVDAGKHVFLAKPVAVDVPGCLKHPAEREKAQGKASFLVDFQTRAQPAFQEAAMRVHRATSAARCWTRVLPRVRRRPGAAPGLVARRGAAADVEPRPTLSGDIIVEQNIHAIDVGNWLLQGRPVKATGTSGRSVRMKYGELPGLVRRELHLPNQVAVDFSSVQFAKGFYDICARIYGAEGRWTRTMGSGSALGWTRAMTGS